MAFTCGTCGKEISNSKMAGIIIFLLGKALLSQGPKIANIGLFNAGSANGHGNLAELSAGFLTGAGIKCPQCGSCNWD